MVIDVVLSADRRVWGVLIQTSGHCVARSLRSMGASPETASLSSPVIPGNLDIASRTLAVAIWVADAPCSLRTA